MSLTLDQIVEETRSLPRDVVIELVDRILLAAHSGQNAAHEKAWSQTVHRRIAEIEQGTARLIPLDEALAQARARLRR
ncbi:addiction module protein [Nibricoccus sp. IMCC34717]|uniref:addiction module protein n=1 Tax=Nibricoccus sp. IMCC34717 TaxID=3034021 RepID=UPI00384DF8A3